MARKKVKLVFISNDSARKLSSKKRRVGLLKKVSELTVLCGVDAFCIIYSLDEIEPMVWPSPPVVQNLLVRYLNLPNNGRSKKSLNQESYLKERIEKAEDISMKNLKKIKDMNLRRYMRQVHQGMSLDYLTADELACFGSLVQEKLIDIAKRMEYFDQNPPPRSLFAYNVGGAQGIFNPHDIIQWNHNSAEVLMNNYGIGADESTNDVKTLITNNVRAINNYFYQDIDPRVTSIGGFNMGSPNLVTNFNGGRLAINNVIGGSNTNRLEPPHESVTDNVNYGVGFDFRGQTQGFGNNIENVNAMSLGMPYGSRGNSGHHQVSPYNYAGSEILTRNWYNQVELPNEYTNLEFGNEIGVRSHTNNFVANIGENEWNNATIGVGLSNNHIHENVNFGGGSIARSDNTSSQNTLFGSASHVQRSTTTNNNNLAQ